MHCLIDVIAFFQEHMELEKRYCELTDLLYYKQTQLETLASENAATEFQLEKEIKKLQEAQVEVERSRVPCRASTSWEEDTEIKTLDYLITEGRKIPGFRSCQGHKIPLTISNSSNNLAILSCVCTSLLDVLVASPSGTSG